MSIELLSTFKTQAILDVYNHLNPEAQLKSWDKNKSILVERIVSKHDASAIEKAIAATEDGPKPGTKGKVVKTAKAPKAKAEKKAKATGEKKPRAAGIGAAIKAQILKTPEASAQEILDKVLPNFPEASTTVACVGWYRSKMYKTGELVK